MPQNHNQEKRAKRKSVEYQVQWRMKGMPNWMWEPAPILCGPKTAKQKSRFANANSEMREYRAVKIETTIL